LHLVCPKLQITQQLKAPSRRDRYAVPRYYSSSTIVEGDRWRDCSIASGKGIPQLAASVRDPERDPRAKDSSAFKPAVSTCCLIIALIDRGFSGCGDTVPQPIGQITHPFSIFAAVPQHRVLPTAGRRGKRRRLARQYSFSRIGPIAAASFVIPAANHEVGVPPALG
jgi:hypothetical protein